MSGILGLDLVTSSLTTYEEAFKAKLGEIVGEEIKTLQRDTVDLIPERTGQLRRAFGDATAIKQEKVRGEAGGWRYRYGLVTKELQRQGYYGLWVEFGRKSYQKGDERKAGKTKNGRQRHARVKRAIGAARAEPFIRPAFILFQRRMATGRALAKIHAAAMTAAGRG